MVDSKLDLDFKEVAKDELSERSWQRLYEQHGVRKEDIVSVKKAYLPEPEDVA